MVMDILEINHSLLDTLYEQALQSERLRMNRDLRTSSADTSQRMLNALQPGTQVPIHRHRETAESIICLQGCMDVVVYDDHALETHRTRLCPAEGKYGVQLPLGAWHTVEVYELSTIFEAKDGAFKPISPEDIMER